MVRHISAILLGCTILAAPLAVQAQGVLQIATDQSPVGLDPHIATAFSTALVDSVLYEGLTAIDAGLRVIPALAESWTVSPDGKTYVFTLRHGATFANGRVMTAADVAASIARVRDPKTGSPIASRFTAINKVETGEGTVTITLEAPSAAFLGQLAGLAIIAPEAVAEIGRKPVGTGPFRLTAWVPDTAITLERNPGYWQAGLPKLAGVTFNIVPDAATRQLGLASGTYKMLPSLDAATATALAGAANVKLLQAQDLAYSLVGVNVTHAPFDKPEVREAMNMAIDRAQLVQAAYFGRAVPGGPLSPALSAWALPTSDFPCYRPDAAAAKKKLTDAGLTLPVKVTLNVLGSLAIVVDVAQVVQAQLNKAGFDVSLNVQEQGKFVADWRASNFEGFVSLNGGSPDPDDYFGRTFQTGGATNVFKYSNPALDRLLNDARIETVTARRKDMYDQAQKLLACGGPTVNLAYGTLFTAVRADVTGFTPLATRSLWTLRETTIGQ